MKNISPLMRSASFTISVDSVEIEPVITYAGNGLASLAEDEEQEDSHLAQNGTKNNFHNGHGTTNGVDKDTTAEVVEEEVEDVEAPVVIIPGADWESVNYTVTKLQCEDEVTGLAVSKDYIVAQFFLEPEIHVYSRESLTLLHRLSGHDYGGQAVQILDHVLYSGSKDFTVCSWDLQEGEKIAEVKDHRDYVQCLCVRRVHMSGLGEDGEVTTLVTGGAADHRVIVYSTDCTGSLKKRFLLEGHTGWITGLEVTDTMVISGSKDATIRLWDLASGELLTSTSQDADITCMSIFNLRSGYLIFGDEESKLSLLDLASGQTIHLMPNTLVGTGRYRRSSKYHDKSVDSIHLCDNGYMVSASSGSKFVKIWKIENYDGEILKTDVAEIQILRDHSDYLNVIRVEGNTIFSSSGDSNIYMHKFPEGEQHYDMLRTQERNSVAVLFQGPEKGLAPTCEKPAIVCEGRLCKAGKTGLAKSSSSFQVSFSLKPQVACAEGRLLLPQTIEEDSDEDDSSAEYVIEYVTDTEEEEGGDEEW